MKCGRRDVLLVGLASAVGVVLGAEESVTLMQHTKKMSVDSDGDLIDVHSSVVLGSPADCAEKYAKATNSIMECMARSNLASPKFFEYVSNNHDIGQSQLIDMWLNMAKAEALSTMSEECSLTETFHWDPEDVALINYAGKKSAVELVRFRVEMLEDPRVGVALAHQFGEPSVAEFFRTSVNAFRTVCGGDPDQQLFDAQEGCRDHLNLDAFLNMVKDTVTTCSSLESEELMQHQVLRQRRDHTRAKLVQVLHAPTNRLGHHFHRHLHAGGSEFNMNLLISHAVANANLTARQVAMLQHIEASHPLEHLASTCSTWESQRSNISDPIVAKSVLLQNKDYRTFMDCLCDGNDLKVVCQANFMKNMDSLTKDLHRMQKKQLATQALTVETVEKLNTSTWASPYIGPCLLSDAFSCEICLSSFCAPLGRPKPKGRKNKADDESPFVVVKNALTAKATDFKIACTACASLHPGEQVSFEVEMYLSTNFQNMDTMFTGTKIGIDAKTCVGPGSPIRAIADTLGLNVCMSNLKAEYLPFLGDFDVEGRVPGPHGTQIRLTFGTAIHDPPTAVRNYCTDQAPRTEVQCSRSGHTYKTIRFGSWTFKIPVYECVAYHTVTLSAAQRRSRGDSCYNAYKNKAGPMLFSAASTIPLVWGGEFEIVKVSGPHSSGITWRVELFQMPFDKVAQALKDLWDNEIGPAMENALNEIGDGAEAAGEWTLGAANSAGKWTVGAVDDIGSTLDDAGQWTSGAVDDIGGGFEDAGNWAGGAASDVGDFFGFR